MTNLSANKTNKKVFITPELALIIIPSVIGTFSSILLLITIFAPLLTELNTKARENIILREKISFIPIYKRSIKKLISNKIAALSQQERLLELVAGEDKIRTIISKLNTIAINNDCKILDFKPKSIKKFTQTHSINNNIAPTADPLLKPTLERHFYEVIVSGEYNNLILLLRELELLQTIVITSDMEIQMQAKSYQRQKFGADKNYGQLDNRLLMKFGITTYGRIKY